MTRSKSILPVLTVAVCALAAAPALAAPSTDLVISQVYGGGGNSGAPLTNDFVELFNRGTVAVSLSGKTVQYTSASGTGLFSSNVTTLPNLMLQPGQYFLVKEATNNAAVGSPLPAADATGSINMSANGGKVALVNGSGLACNGGSTLCSDAQKAIIIDLVGYDGANFFEGAGAAPSLISTTAAFRANGGCVDSDNNAADFSVGAPSPRNTSSTIKDCQPSTGLGIASTSATPATLSAGDSTTLAVTVSPGSHPDSTGIAVSADLSSIGGASSQSFTGDGSGSFSFLTTVSATVAAGTKSIPVTASDDQSRTATGSISLTVTPFVPHVAIHDIQGTSNFANPLYVGHLVQTEGIVTAVRNNGYFLQAPDAEADADSNTSEGIFVFTGSSLPSVATIGSRLQVRANVQDFIPGSDPGSPPVTELSGTVTVTRLSTGNPLPAAIVLGPSDFNPNGSVSQLAKYEGMRVHLDGPITAVAPSGGTISEANATSTSSGSFYGVLPGVARPFREAGIEAPAVAPAGVPQFDANPERVRVNTKDWAGSTALNIATGAVISNLTGVLDFTFRSYTILTDPSSPPTVTNNDAHAIPVRQGAGEGELVVASFNMERFFDTFNDPSTSDVKLTTAALDLRLTKASLVIRNVLQMPDVIGLEEMENPLPPMTNQSESVTPTDGSVILQLTQKIDDDAIAAGQTPPHYQAYETVSNDIGGISAAFLVKPSRIAVLEVSVVDDDPISGHRPYQWTQPDGSKALLNDRPPLVLKASVIPQGKELPFNATIIVNHLRSLSGIDDDSNPDQGPRIRAKRLAQAEFLASLIDSYQAAGDKVISVGDYNAFDVNDGFVDVINTVRGGAPHPGADIVGEPDVLVTPELIDLAPADPAQHYSYVFDGNAQVLDHIIVSQSLAVNEFTYARNDADFPESLRGDRTRPERISDHDMPVAYFPIARDTIAPVVTLNGPADGATYLLGTVPGASCSTTDAGGAGVRTAATLTVSGGPVGAVTATCGGAVDNVGNIGNVVVVRYTVVAYTFVGFGAPLDGASTTVKGGSTVPVKFQIFDWNGALVTDTSVIAAIQVSARAGCSSSTTGAWDDATATGNTGLRFDATSSQFVFNWKTTGLAAGCYSLGVSTVDTLTHAAAVVIR
ncbi:MAG: PxKF domain-containing protein [Myxococcales bacterium]|nr:PxKF domain-containing protein [Myxococcales bacterium]